MLTKRFITKRNGQQEPFKQDKVDAAISNAFKSCGYPDIPEELYEVYKSVDFQACSSVEEIQDKLEEILFGSEYKEVYNHFVTYRANHALMREIKTKTLFDSIIGVEKNEVTRENGNMNSDTPAGMMMKFASETTKAFSDRYVLDEEVKKAQKDNLLHIHDKDYYLTRSLTCLQHPLDRILQGGFQSGHGSARPAKRIETAAIQACISMETIQNEMHGGQAIPAFDFYMAPYVRLTYIEEVNKIKDLLCDEECNGYWDEIRNAKIDDYTIEELPASWVGDGFEPGMARIKQMAINATVKRVHQAMESFIHNMNSIHSRGGNQVVFSSINYGTDTSAEGRCIIRELLKSTERGVGNNATAIFPIQIWKMKAGVSVNPGDRNYDLYKYSLKVAARRFFPNYLNLDSTFNKDEDWNENDPKRYMHEVATMGCRTRVYENRFGPKTSVGRGNISFSTINLVKLAIEVAIKDGYLVKTDNGYERSVNNSEEDIDRRLGEFYDKCLEMTRLTAKQLDQRFQFQKQALAKQFPLLMKGMWNGSENLNPEDTIENVINQGTLGIGFIGLAEALVALTGKHHAEDEYLQAFGLTLIGDMHLEAGKLSEKYQHNYSILATPAEGLSGKFTKRDQKEFGIIQGVTDKEYYTNSNHVPVYYKCSASHKAKIECPYHKYTRGGHIFYVEADYDPTKNPEAIDAINTIARANDGGYISFNHNQGRCNYCNYESDDPNLVHGDTCPHCGRKGAWDQLSRITGYLVSTTDRWGQGKLAELNDRVQHM